MIAGVYALFEKLYNGKCYDSTGARVAQEISENDMVLECVCGTGSISKPVAPKCKRLIATDMSVNMLKHAQKNCRECTNITFKKADMMSPRCKNNRFDKVIAGSVIHVLDAPYRAVDELLRVCKPCGKVIIPTYINAGKRSSELLVKFFDFFGANFTNQFDRESYKEFFINGGYDAEIDIVDGRMPCAIAVITKK